MGINFREFLCRYLGRVGWIYKVCDCQRYEPRVDVMICLYSGKIAGPYCLIKELRRYKHGDEPVEICTSCAAPMPPPPEYPTAPDYNGRLIGTTAYSLIKYPFDEIEWFLRELVKAGGNATEMLFVTTWDGTWDFQPYRVAKWETEMWADKDWNTGGPNYEFPVYDLTKWDELIWEKWRKIFDLCGRMGITVIVRVQDYCSRKDNFLERHWAFWSNVQSWRWGGWMHGGYLHWPIGDGGRGGKEFIWPYYDALNKRLVEMLGESGVEYYIEPWNELTVTKGSQYATDAPDEVTINTRVHQWFRDSLCSHGCPPDRVIYNIQRLGRSDADWAAHAKEALRDGFAAIEYHGCASPERLLEYAKMFGSGRVTFPNGDGTDGDAEGKNDGRPNYTEPSYDQGKVMGRLVRERNLFGYIYKNRWLRGNKPLTNAKFDAVRGLAEGIK